MATICNKCNKECTVHYGSDIQEVLQLDTHHATERVLNSDCCGSTVRAGVPLGDVLDVISTTVAVGALTSGTDEGGFPEGEDAVGVLRALERAGAGAFPEDVGVVPWLPLEGETCQWLAGVTGDLRDQVRGAIEEVLRITLKGLVNQATEGVLPPDVSKYDLAKAANIGFYLENEK